jgi:hypothetical protein
VRKKAAAPKVTRKASPVHVTRPAVTVKRTAPVRPTAPARVPARRVTYAPPVTRAPVKHPAKKAVHHRRRVAPPKKPVLAAVLGVRHTTHQPRHAIAALPAATVRTPGRSGMVTAFWIVAVGLPALALLASRLPGLALPNGGFVRDWEHRSDVAQVSAIVLALDAGIYFLG